MDGSPQTERQRQEPYPQSEIQMNPYFEQMILSASPVELIRLLYQRAIALVGDAREHLANGRVAERSAAISKAWEVLLELITSLQPDQAPELTQRLRSLYCYMQERLNQANFQQKDEPLAEVAALLNTLAEGWSVISEGSQEAPAPQKPRSPWANSAGCADEEHVRVAISA